MSKEIDFLHVEEGKGSETEEKEEEKEPETFADEYATKPRPTNVASTAEDTTTKPGAVSVSGNDESVSAKKNKESSNGEQRSHQKQKQQQRAKHEKKKETKREINEKFKDLHSTGKWGSISKTEIYSGIAVGVVIVIGAIVAAVVLVTGDDEELEPPPLPTISPSIAPTFSTSSAMDVILQAISNTPSLSESLDLSSDINFYTDQYNDESESPAVRAMSWALNLDQAIHGIDSVVDRFALASFYFGTQGKDWTNNNKWLQGSSSICEWYGVLCDRSGSLEDISLVDNNVANNVQLDIPPIPGELALLSTLKSLTLSSNELVGGLSSATFLDMESLSTLNLDNNKLTGTIPRDLPDVGLSKFYD